MRALWLCFILQSFQIFAEAAFGTPYLQSSRLCQKWTCINNKLGLPNSLPPREQFDITLRSLLPEGAWQDVVEKVLDTCYQKRTRVYTNTCPGQALLQCTFDNLIDKCPDSSRREKDGCSPPVSFAGMNYMFSQSVYADMEQNMPKDRRPVWFLKNYFSSKCCNLPPMFNSSVLKDCGFVAVGNYYEHPINFMSFRSKTNTTPAPIDRVRIARLDEMVPSTPSSVQTGDFVRIATPEDMDKFSNPNDPLDCCDLTNFIQPSWRAECDFRMSWDPQTRLTVDNSTRTTTMSPVTTTAAPLIVKDLKIIPVSTDRLTCVFNKINMLTEIGDVKVDSFIKLLDNYTRDHEEFSKAKARVITECLTKPLLTYDGDSQINKVIACTYDLLSENCPYYNKKNDTCKSPTTGMVCQISSSRYRAKSRRTICNLPNLVPSQYMMECDITSLVRQEIVSQKITTVKKHGWSFTRTGCVDATDSTTCLMKKMGVLNKYKFMDYFKMKDKIRQFTDEKHWYSTDVYLSAFTNTPLYNGHCNSPKKLFNVIDSLLVSCPFERRNHSPQCNKIFGTSHYQHKFPVIPTFTKMYNRTEHNPIYNYGILASGDVPPVKIIDVKPATIRPTVTLRLPVYMLRFHTLPVTAHKVGNNLLRSNHVTIDPNSVN